MSKPQITKSKSLTDAENAVLVKVKRARYMVKYHAERNAKRTEEDVLKRREYMREYMRKYKKAQA